LADATGSADDASSIQPQGAEQGAVQGTAAGVEYVEVEERDQSWIWGTGRRKTAVARVRIRPGDGKVVVNKRPFESYFPVERHRTRALAPLKLAQYQGKVDVYANIRGGGITGQADAMLMGLARALVRFDARVEQTLKQAGHLTRDSRKVERKKYGKHKARRSHQYSKR
jgi:small subunit ribosomal protein S9